MTDIKIVSGLNYGDEGKGLVANYVSTPNSLTVMASNSCQRGHTVVENGIRKVFRHFGSATLKGAATYFSKEFMANPAMFRKEYEELEAMGIINPKVYCREGVFLITPMDMMGNVEAERQRGENSWSSTGCGVWAAMQRGKVCSIGVGHPLSYSNGGLIKDYYIQTLYGQFNGLSNAAMEFYYGPRLIDHFHEDLQFLLDHIIIIHNDKEEEELLRSFPLIVFENSQGLLLDDRYSRDILHNTPAYVGCRAPADVIAQNFSPKEVDIEALYVTRTYFTRHGKGEIGFDGECDKADINPNMIDKTNVPNPHQGTLRYGKIGESDAKWLDIRARWDTQDLVLRKHNVKTGIVVTHINEYENDILINKIKNSPHKLYVSGNEYSFKEGE